MKIREVIIVEGKYDKIAVESAVEAEVIQTDGFGIFSDKEKMNLIRKIANKKGIIVLTDSDSAGFLIRKHLKGCVGSNIKHAYIPDVFGKERRKTTPSKEHKLGVEGMKKDIIISALRNAGATFEDEDISREKNGEKVTKTDMYLLGLSGGEGSAEKRKALLRKLDLPERMSANAILDVINILYGKDEFLKLVENL